MKNKPFKKESSKKADNQDSQLNIFEACERSNQTDSFQEPCLNEEQSLKQEKPTISQYIDKHYERVGSLIEKYHPPTSTFLPKPRSVEKEIIYNIEDIKALYEKFSDYTPLPISTRDIELWISQFETFLDKNIAFLLLKKMQFLSRQRVIKGCNSLREQLMSLLKRQAFIKSAFLKTVNSSLEQKDSAFESWIENHCIHYSNLQAGKGNTSQTRMQQTYEVLWDVYKANAVQHCHQVRRFEDLKFHFSQSKKDADAAAFIFMDFTNASGDTLTNNVRAISTLVDEHPKWRNSFYVFLNIVEAESFDMGTLKTVLPNSSTLCAEPMLVYNDASVIALLESYQILEAEYKNFIEKYCSLFGDMGYKDGGFLTCHYYSCPNNTLPFFYKEKPGSWTRLFQNSQIPRSGTYH